MKFKSLFRRKTVDQILDEIHQHDTDQAHGLVKSLTLRDLTAMGIAAVVGAGIFSTIGSASAAGGPAVSLLFVFTAVACVFSALCYAEFAATIPISGSAYTYTYTAFGELAAWVIGWNLLLEYAIGNVVLAISWSDYLTGLLDGLGWHVPDYFAMDYRSAAHAHALVTGPGANPADLSATVRTAAAAWQAAPQLGGLRLIVDLPALLINVFITALVYIGIRESKNVGNWLVVLKLSIIALVVAVGAFYVKPENWSPFAPNGIGGVLRGVSAVFFAYIGFDAISTTAEECKNPQRDLPKAMIYVLIICTILYVVVTLILTGMVNYRELNVGDPMAFVFERIGLHKIAGLVAISAVIATTSVMLVFQLGQPRIWMTMSRDGLLPRVFSDIHPRFKTPAFSTIITGLLVAVPTLFFNLQEMTDFTSIGTLFAFALVSGGVLVLENDNQRSNAARFRVPYVNGKFIVPTLLVALAFALATFNPDGFANFFNFRTDAGQTWWGLVEHRILLLGFLVVCALMAWLSYARSLSLIPVLGLLVNLYLMTELGVTNWARFILWLFVGLIIYFAYGYRHSKLAR